MSMDLTNNTPSRFSSTIRAKRTRVNDSPGHKDIMKDIEGDLALLDRGTDVPPFMKNIVLHLINIVQEQATIISSISLENQSLSSDIIALKAKAAENAPVSVPVTTVCSDPVKNVNVHVLLSFPVFMSLSLLMLLREMSKICVRLNRSSIV